MQTASVTLANYTNFRSYIPKIGDFVIWSRWFSTWHGIISGYDEETDMVDIIFAGVPYLLFTMDDTEQASETKKIKLSTIKNAHPGAWAILRHETESKANIWYI